MRFSLGPVDRSFLYEIYTDQAALEVHLASENFKTFGQETRSLVRGKTLHAYSVDQNAKA